MDLLILQKIVFEVKLRNKKRKVFFKLKLYLNIYLFDFFPINFVVGVAGCLLEKMVRTNFLKLINPS